jgi:hypothetical protein
MAAVSDVYCQRFRMCAQEYEEETVRRFIQCMQARGEVEQRNVSE